MPGPRALAIAVATLISAGCSSGDLTLPGSPSGPTPGPASTPTTLTVVAGDDQQARVGETLDTPLMVQVLDAAAQPIAGVQVRFAFEGDGAGGSVDPAVATTDADGHAEASVRLGDEPGQQTIVAGVTAVPALSARFTVTATKDKRGRGGGGEGD